jgi:Uma2 family endonuclease
MATALLSPPESLTDAAPDPLESDDALREVIRGQVLEKPLSTFATWVGTRLAASLSLFVEGRLGYVVTEGVFVLDEDRINQPRPDVAYISANRLPLNQLPPLQGYWQVVPDLAVEIASPTDRFENVIDKAAMYLTAGVAEVWLVIPKSRSVMIQRGDGSVTILRAEESLATPLIPGWSMPVGELLPEAVSQRPETA